MSEYHNYDLSKEQLDLINSTVPTQQTLIDNSPIIDGKLAGGIAIAVAILSEAVEHNQSIEIPSLNIIYNRQFLTNSKELP